MNPSDPTLQSVYERCDPAYLRDLREAAGMDIFILARNACLSVGQVRELESGQQGHYFYSDTIKRQAYKRVLMLLGAEPPQAHTASRLTEPPPDLEARLAPLDSIAAMSHRPQMSRSAITVLQPYLERLKTHAATIGLFCLVALTFASTTQYLREHLANATPITPPQVATHTPDPKSSPIPSPAPALSVKVDAPSEVSDFTCAHSQETLPQWSPKQARKEGRYVYLVSSASAEVCVVDGQKQITHVKMKAGDSQSVYGVAPWQISGSNLNKVKVYFQGELVVLPQEALPALLLVQAPVTP